MTAPCKHEHDISHNGVHWQHRNATKQIPSTPRDTVKTHTRIMTQTDSRWQLPYVVHWPWARQPCACRHTSIIESSSSSLAISLNFSLGTTITPAFYRASRLCGSGTKQEPGLPRKFATQLSQLPQSMSHPTMLVEWMVPRNLSRSNPKILHWVLCLSNEFKGLNVLFHHNSNRYRTDQRFHIRKSLDVQYRPHTHILCQGRQHWRLLSSNACWHKVRPLSRYGLIL